MVALAFVLFLIVTMKVTNSFPFQAMTTIKKSLNFPTIAKISKNGIDAGYTKLEEDDDLRARFAGADDPEVEEATLYRGVQDREGHVALLDRSLRQLTGCGILERVGLSNDSDISALLTNSRYALYSHGILKPDMIDGAIHNYANFGALAFFGVTYKQFVQLPCSRIAPPGFHQKRLGEIMEELELLVAETSGLDMAKAGFTQGKACGGFIENYSGLRCRLDLTNQGLTFHIKNAVIWNIVDDEGRYYGQATLFDREAVEIV